MVRSGLKLKFLPLSSSNESNDFLNISPDRSIIILDSIMFSNSLTLKPFFLKRFNKASEYFFDFIG